LNVIDYEFCTLATLLLFTVGIIRVLSTTYSAEYSSRKSLNWHNTKSGCIITAAIQTLFMYKPRPQFQPRNGVYAQSHWYHEYHSIQIPPLKHGLLSHFGWQPEQIQQPVS